MTMYPKDIEAWSIFNTWLVHDRGLHYNLHILGITTIQSAHLSPMTMVYGRYIYIVPGIITHLNLGAAPPCSECIGESSKINPYLIVCMYIYIYILMYIYIYIYVQIDTNLSQDPTKSRHKFLLANFQLGPTRIGRRNWLTRRARKCQGRIGGWAAALHILRCHFQWIHFSQNHKVT